jgi:hypothetical protein
MSLCPPFHFQKILARCLVASCAHHGKLFNTHSLYVGTDHERHQVRWNNYPWKFCGPVLQLFELLAVQLHISITWLITLGRGAKLTMGIRNFILQRSQIWKRGKLVP